MKNFLSIDQGTTSSRAIIFDENLRKLSDSQKEYNLSYPKDGWVELNPKNILKSVQETVSNVLKNNLDIEACGITNQRETTVVWSKSSGEPIYPAIVWQDRRTSEFCDQLKKDGNEKEIKDKTGLLLDPYFSASKIKWILDNVSGARAMAKNGDLLFGTIDTYLIYKLTEEKNHLTDVTNASRTSLFNIKTMDWDDGLLEIFDIPRNMLPKVISSDGFFGTLKIEKKIIPIRGVIGDQQAALVGQGCFKYGDMKSTYGTGCFIMVNTEEKPIYVEEGLLTTIAYKFKGKTHYAIEGSIYSSGNIIKWLRDKMKFFSTAKESEKFLSKNGNSNKVYFLPAFNGLGAPFWDSNIRGGFYGLTQDSSVDDIVTSCFMSIAFQTKEIASILNKYNISIKNLLVDGGMVENDTFCQMLSDTLLVNIIRPDNVESTALGACKVSMLGSGIEMPSNKSIKSKAFTVNEDNIESFVNNYRNWSKYVADSLSSVKG